VYAYITWGNHLLVFRHVDYPDAGIQVPGGTVEPGESFKVALMREVREETGLTDCTLMGLLGEQERDMSSHGVNEIQHQRFYHLKCGGTPPEHWRHVEEYADDGSGPLVFEYSWVRLNNLPGLVGTQGDFLHRLLEKYAPGGVYSPTK